MPSLRILRNLNLFIYLLKTYYLLIREYCLWISLNKNMLIFYWHKQSRNVRVVMCISNVSLSKSIDKKPLNIKWPPALLVFQVVCLSESVGFLCFCVFRLFSLLAFINWWHLPTNIKNKGDRQLFNNCHRSWWVVVEYTKLA